MIRADEGSIPAPSCCCSACWSGQWATSSLGKLVTERNRESKDLSSDTIMPQISRSWGGRSLGNLSTACCPASASQAGRKLERLRSVSGGTWPSGTWSSGGGGCVSLKDKLWTLAVVLAQHLTAEESGADHLVSVPQRSSSAKWRLRPPTPTCSSAQTSAKASAAAGSVMGPAGEPQQ